MKLSSIDLFLWVAGLVGHCILLLVLLLRKRAKTFHVFCSLIAFNIARTFVLMSVRHAGLGPYFYTYWTLATLDVLLQLAVLWEATLHVFRPSGTFRPDINLALASMFGGSVVLAALLTWLASPPAVTSPALFVLRGDLFASVLMSELFTGMVVLAATSGLPWKTHSARIVQGLGVNSLADFLIEGLQNFYGFKEGSSKYDMLSEIEKSVYIGVLVFWIVTLHKDAPEPRELPPILLAQLHKVQVRVEKTLRALRVGTSHI